MRDKPYLKTGSYSANQSKPELYLTTNETETLDKLLDKGWELLVFKAHPPKAAEQEFLKRGGFYGAGFVDTSGDVSDDAIDYCYAPTVQLAIKKAIRRWKEQEEL